MILSFFNLQITFSVATIHIKPLLKILLNGCLLFEDLQTENKCQL